MITTTSVTLACRRQVPRDEGLSIVVWVLTAQCISSENKDDVDSGSVKGLQMDIKHKILNVTPCMHIMNQETGSIHL